MDVVRIKCGQIYILSDDNFSLICEFCEDEFLTLVELRDHLIEHFPKTPKSIKKEESLSSDSDCEITSWDVVGGVKDEIVPDVQQYYNVFEFIKVEGQHDVEESGPSLLEKTETTMDNEHSKGSEDEDCTKETLGNGTGNKSNEKIATDQQSRAYQEIEGTSSTKENDGVISYDSYSKRLRKKTKQNFRQIINPSNADGTDSDGSTDYTEPNKTDIPDNGLKTKLPFECSYCSDRFKHDRNRNYHENTHTGRLPQCRECSKTFSSLDKMTQHLKKHRNDLKCTICSEIFRYKSELDNHRKKKHMPKKARRGKHIPCLLCNVKLTTSHHLKLHMAAHKRKDERKNVIYTCDYCRKQFKKKESIVSHIQIHSGIKPFKCGNCGKAFLQFSNVRQHEMSCYRRSANKDKSK